MPLRFIRRYVSFPRRIRLTSAAVTTDLEPGGVDESTWRASPVTIKTSQGRSLRLVDVAGPQEVARARKKLEEFSPCPSYVSRKSRVALQNSI